MSLSDEQFNMCCLCRTIFEGGTSRQIDHRIPLLSINALKETYKSEEKCKLKDNNCLKVEPLIESKNQQLEYELLNRLKVDIFF